MAQDRKQLVEDAASDALLREVDEDLRRDQLETVWKKYGNWLMGAALLLVAGVGGYEVWKTQTEKTHRQDGLKFAQAMGLADDGKIAEAADALALLAKEASGGYKTLAKMRRAALLAETNDSKAALAAYEALAADSSLDKMARDLAVLEVALLQADAPDAKDIEARLQPLAQADNPWRHSATEILALRAQRAGDLGKARELFAKLADDNAAPQNLRARAAEMLAALKGA